MTSSDGQDYSDMSLLHLFSLEAETQTALLNDGLLTLERDPQHAESLEALMRAAHSSRVRRASCSSALLNVWPTSWKTALWPRKKGVWFTSEHRGVAARR